MSNASRARKVEANFCTYLNTRFDTDLRWYPTRGQIQVDGAVKLLEPPYGVVVCSRVTPANPGTRNFSDIMQFKGETRVILITPSDNPQLGPMSAQHDTWLRTLRDALVDRDRECASGPITDQEALFRLHGFTLVSEETMTERYRFGDIITLSVAAKG